MSGGTPTQPMASGPETLAGGRYHLHRRLGAGGMGIVVQATDTRLGREVAVKLLADNLAADETARERFLREARAAAMLSDPHVVQVHDVDEENGRPYLVMELVEGSSLGDVLALEGPLDPGEVVDVAADALAGLARAHGAGLLHRDIKPGNLMRRPDGLVKVTDFGVAQAADHSELTHTGMVVGTGPYLAPERTQGQPATVRTDLYALGSTLYELLTGLHPGADPDLASLDDAVPARLRNLLDRLLSTDPQLRPASAEAALVLLAGEIDTPTQAMAVEEAPDETVPLAPLGHAPAAGGQATTEVIDRTPFPSDEAAGPMDEEPPPTRGPAVPWGIVVAVAVGLLLIALAFQVLRGDGEEPAPTGVERSEDPAETARNLADWLQQRAGD
jgi:eukaryotic-like serine/threonine-protein kinase